MCYGIAACKQPLSGALQDFPHDVQATIAGGRVIVEVKARKGQQKTLERWRGQADMLLYKADRGEFMVWMPLEVFGQIVKTLNDRIK